MPRKNKPVTSHRNKPLVQKSSSGDDIENKLEEMSVMNPVPFDGGTGFSFQPDAEYLLFLSPDDNYGQLLLQSRLLSNTHNSCVITKKDYCAGKGFRTEDDQDITDKDFNSWLISMNLMNESILKINKKIFESLFTYGNVPIELVRFTLAGKRYFYIYIHNFLEWRLGKPNEDDICEYAVQSKLFLRNNIRFTNDDFSKARKLPIYNPLNKDKKAREVKSGINWFIDKNGAERTMLWYKNDVTGFPYYGVPSAVAGLIYEILEYKGARFNLDCFDNDMVVSAILALKGNLTQKEINRIGRKVVNTHTGDGRRSRVMVVGSEEGLDGSDLHALNTHKEGSYKDIDETWMQKIILANQWDAMLAGIISQSTLGKGMGYLSKVIETKQKTVIIPAQQELMIEVWKPILRLVKPYMGFKIDPENIEIRNSIDISALTDVDVTPAVTVDEVREAKGLPKAKDPKKGDMFLGELGAEQKKGVYVKQTSSGDNNQ